MTTEELQTHSGLEAELLRLCRENGIPPPAVNVPLEGFIVDFLWRPAGLVVETDTYRFHGSVPVFRSDRNRDVDLILAGFRVARFTREDVFDEPERTARKLRGLLKLDG